MGVLNITPDSFSDGGELFDGKTVRLDAVLTQASAMVEAGAVIWISAAKAVVPEPMR